MQSRSDGRLTGGGTGPRVEPMSKEPESARVRREAEFFKALASEVRIGIVHCLSRGERSVGEIVEALAAMGCGSSTERTNVSKHLAVLREARIVSSREDGLRRLYRLDFSCLLHTLDCVDRMGRQGPEYMAACAPCPGRPGREEVAAEDSGD